MKKIIIVIFSVLQLLLYISIRACWSGIQKSFGAGLAFLPYLLLFFSITSVVLLFVNYKWLKKKVYTIISLTLGGLVFLITLVIMSQSLDYLFLYLDNLLDEILYVLIIGLVSLLLVAFIYRDYSKIKNDRLRSLLENTSNNIKRKQKYLFLILSISIFCFVVVDVLSVGILYIENKPVVYAVNSEYQIIFKTSVKATAQIDINSTTYGDTYAGSLKSDYNHKIVIPMSILDSEPSYTIKIRYIYYRGPYSAIELGSIKYTNKFKAPSFDDGLNYQMIADVHDYSNGALKALKYFKDDLDFLIVNGDIVSWITDSNQLSYVANFCRDASKGQIPVIYSRGNHETKGEYAKDLDKYVGSDNGKFYYEVKLNCISAFVVDLGEDHGDDWWEFYGTAQFNQYRQDQIDWLNSIQTINTSKVRIAISHIPLSYSGNNDPLREYKIGLCTALNRLKLDFSVSGHMHELIPSLRFNLGEIPFTKIDGVNLNKMRNKMAFGNGAEFPEFTGSRHSNGQFDNQSNIMGLSRIALAIKSTSASSSTIKYVNSKLKVLDILEPYTNLTQNEFVITRS